MFSHYNKYVQPVSNERMQSGGAQNGQVILNAEGMESLDANTMINSSPRIYSNRTATQHF